MIKFLVSSEHLKGIYPYLYLGRNVTEKKKSLLLLSSLQDSRRWESIHFKAFFSKQIGVGTSRIACWNLFLKYGLNVPIKHVMSSGCCIWRFMNLYRELRFMNFLSGHLSGSVKHWLLILPTSWINIPGIIWCKLEPVQTTNAWSVQIIMWICICCKMHDICDSVSKGKFSFVCFLSFRFN